MPGSSAPPSTIKPAVTGTVVSGTVANQTSEEAAASTSDWPSKPEARHIDLVIRAVTSLARLSPAHGDRVRYALMAAQYAWRLWDMNMKSLNAAAAEKVYLQMTAAERRALGKYDAWLLQRSGKC